MAFYYEKKISIIVDILSRLVNILSTRQPFWKYLICVFLIFSFYIGLNFLIQAIPFQSIDFGNNVTFNKTAELEKIALDYTQNRIPYLTNSFWTIFYNNFIASLRILFVPVVIFSVVSLIGKVVSIFDESFLKLNSIFCKILLVFYFTFSYVVKTFSQLFFVFILPLPIFLTTYTHGIVEIPAMVLSLTFSLVLIDDVHEVFEKYLKSEISIPLKKFIKNIAIFITVLTVLLIIAAFVETQITPYLVQKSFEEYFHTI
jgi:hypothetical protein